MSTIAPAHNTLDWLTGAWANIQATSSSTGIAILDAVSGKSPLSDGLSISDGQTLAADLANIYQNFIEVQNSIVGQTALTRIQKDIAAKFAGNSVNKLV
jgi:hypothetical protein